MFCSSCGNQSNGGKFCSFCGAGLANTPPLVNGAAATNAAPSFPATAQTARIESSPTSGSAQAAASTSPVEQAYAAPKVTFGEAIKLGFKGYVVWNARSTRAEFWWWTLFVTLVALGCLIVDSVATVGLLYISWLLAVFLPGLSVCIRRLHDINRNGGWYWIGFIPFVGGIILLIFMCTETHPRTVRWNHSLVSDLRKTSTNT
mgnify:CR=1 FL=1